MKTLAFFSALLLLLSLSGCSLLDRNQDRPVPEPELPPITNEGANTFGCKIDGEVYIGRSPASLAFSRPGVVATFGQKTLNITTNMVNDTSDQGFDLGISNLIAADTFWIEDKSSPVPFKASAGGRYIDMRDRGYFKYSTWLNSGYVVITSMDTTYRSENRHVAGVFDFYVRDEADSTRILHVSDGRFDVRLPW